MSEFARTYAIPEIAPVRDTGHVASRAENAAPRGKHFKSAPSTYVSRKHMAGGDTSATASLERVVPSGEKRTASARSTAARGVAASNAAPAAPVASGPAPANVAASGTASATKSATARPRPTSAQLRAELARERRVHRAARITRSTIYALVIVAAVAVLASTVFMPVFRIYGSSMNPTFTAGDFVMVAKGAKLTQGDPVVFYYQNKALVKRYIASAGQWVDIDDNGNVYVDGQKLDEPYVESLAKGDCDISFPYQVPDGKIFVLGDNRAVSVDSRSSQVGCVSEEQLVGKIVFRIWPLSGFGTVH